MVPGDDHCGSGVVMAVPGCTFRALRVEPLRRSPQQRPIQRATPADLKRADSVLATDSWSGLRFQVAFTCETAL